MKIEYPINETAGYLIYRVGRLLRVKAAGFLDQNNIPLTPEQWGLLLKIHDLGEAPMGRLVDNTLADNANITRQVAGLARHGYVLRTKNPGDKRSNLVQCTEKALKLIQDILPCFMEEKAGYYDGLDQGEVAELIRVLSVLEKNLK